MELWRLIIDFGLVVLIWIVQLIIYPAFKDIEPSRFISWHQQYTRSISFIVFPLMVSQLALYVHATIANPQLTMVIAMILVITLWLHTFLIAVPIHNTLSLVGNQQIYCMRLVRTNWWRVLVWTILFLSTLGNYYF